MPIAETYTAHVRCENYKTITNSNPVIKCHDEEVIGYSRAEVYRELRSMGWKLRNFRNGFAMEAICPACRKSPDKEKVN